MRIALPISLVFAAALLGGTAIGSEKSGVPMSFLNACQSQCERGRQMQAIGADAIAARCATECERDWELPLVATVTDLKKHDGKRVRAKGILRTEKGIFLDLEDKKRLILVGPGVHGGELRALSKKLVVVVGTAQAGSRRPGLEMVSVVAPLRAD